MKLCFYGNLNFKSENIIVPWYQLDFPPAHCINEITNILKQITGAIGLVTEIAKSYPLEF